MPADDRVLPFSEEHCQCLHDALSSIAQTRKFLTECRDCGLDVERAIAENETQARMAERMKANWFPQIP